MAIRLKVTEESRKLQDLVKQDILFFPNTKRLDETVMLIDKEKGKLYNKRTRGDIEERILYQLEKEGEDYVFNNKSKGVVYQTKKIKK